MRNLIEQFIAWCDPDGLLTDEHKRLLVIIAYGFVAGLALYDAYAIAQWILPWLLR